MECYYIYSPPFSKNVTRNQYRHTKCVYDTQNKTCVEHIVLMMFPSLFYDIDIFHLTLGTMH